MFSTIPTLQIAKKKEMGTCSIVRNMSEAIKELKYLFNINPGLPFARSSKYFVLVSKRHRVGIFIDFQLFHFVTSVASDSDKLGQW